LTYLSVQITLLDPNKTDVIAFFDGVARAPPRYARATVAFGATNLTDSFWQEYMVGPLPTTNLSKLQPLTYPFHNQQPGKTKVHPVYSRVDGSAFLTKVSEEIEDVTMELWNSVS
jgi:primary-amine oxidase